MPYSQCFAPTELRSCSGSWLYKHLVPLGPKTTATQGLLRKRSQLRANTRKHLEKAKLTMQAFRLS
jgi:hypothetical protein